MCPLGPSNLQVSRSFASWLWVICIPNNDILSFSKIVVDMKPGEIPHQVLLALLVVTLFSLSLFSIYKSSAKVTASSLGTHSSSHLIEPTESSVKLCPSILSLVLKCKRLSCSLPDPFQDGPNLSSGLSAAANAWHSNLRPTASLKEHYKQFLQV